MKTINTQRWFYFLLIFCISLSPVLLVSCDDDDNGAGPVGTSNDNDNDNDNDDPPGHSGAGNFDLIVSGDMEDELNEGFAFFNDDKEDFARDNETFDPESDAGLVISFTEMVDDSIHSGVSVYIIQKDVSEVGVGTYEATNYITFEQDMNPVIAGLSYMDGTAFISSGEGGNIEITSRSDQTIEGNFNDLELFNMLTNSTVFLNGEFTAKYGK